MEQKALYQNLMEYQQKGRSSFHTPGHKCRPGALPFDPYALDLTELPETDSLFEASGILRAAERNAARVMDARDLAFSAGGCTLCIQAMLRLAAPRGGEIVCGRVIHRAAVNAMALLGLTPIWVLPEANAGAGLPGRVTPGGVEAALRAHPGARAVYVTSPDYYGVLADIAGIAAVCRRFGAKLLVDNAHGAHLGLFREKTPLHPLAQGADYTADSLHKTLPVLTGGAWLCAGEGAADSSAMKEAMALFGSTSPAYPVLASLDSCARWMETEGATAFSRLAERVARLLAFAQARGFSLPHGPRDPVRVTLGAPGVAGTQLAALLRENGVEPEYADGAYVVLLASPFHTEKDFERVEKALSGVRLGVPTAAGPALPPLPPTLLPPREALFAPSEEIPLAQAVGRIAAQAACPCPPGVPVMMPGEKITPACRNFLQAYSIAAIKVVK